MTAKKGKKGERDPREYLMSFGRGRAYVGPAALAREKEIEELTSRNRQDPHYHEHRCSTCDVLFSYQDANHANHTVLPCTQCMSPEERALLLDQYFGTALPYAILAQELARCRPDEEPSGEVENWEGGQWFGLPIEDLIRRRGPEVILDWRPWWAIYNLSRAAKLVFRVEGPAIDAARAGLTEKTGVSPAAKEARAKLRRIFHALTALPRRRPARTFSDEKILLRLRDLKSQGHSRTKAVSRLEREFGKKRAAIEQALHRATESEKKYR